MAERHVTTVLHARLIIIRTCTRGLAHLSSYFTRVVGTRHVLAAYSTPDPAESVYATWPRVGGFKGARTDPCRHSCSGGAIRSDRSLPWRLLGRAAGISTTRMSACRRVHPEERDPASRRLLLGSEAGGVNWDSAAQHHTDGAWPVTRVRNSGWAANENSAPMQRPVLCWQKEARSNCQQSTSPTRAGWRSLALTRDGLDDAGVPRSRPGSGVWDQ
ncbi:hypothetical protein M8818_007075 [Zalaria obscura]|uniref:Uncharacterized protein n=1 Tax=Zalaria obscura TaxID=2024903 RepID=A0ACC3S516_9PEZI